MISVVIPLYNKAEYINKAVGSVLAQSFNAFELIVVNDGSLDNGPAIVAAIADERLRIIHQPHAGVSAARNNGAQAARHEYLAFLDADDWWHQDFLQEMAQLIHLFPGAGLYGCKYVLVKNHREKQAAIELPAGFVHGFIDYIEVYSATMWMPLCSSSVVVPSQVFLASGGFNPRLKLGEDFDLWVRLALHYPVAYLNKALVYYNQDVELKQRAVDATRLHAKESHYIFQLDDLAEAEAKNQPLKTLLDNLRVRALLRYHLSGTYKAEAGAILDQVDFSRQPFFYVLVYKLPIVLIRLYFWFKNQGFRCKQYLMRSLKRWP